MFGIRLPTLPWAVRVGQGGLLAVLLVQFWRAPEGVVWWPLGSITLATFLFPTLLHAYLKRDYYDTKAPPLWDGGRGRMTLYGMILPDGKVVRSPFTGREGVAFVVCTWYHAASPTWVATTFRVRRPGGSVVRVWLPWRRSETEVDGPRRRVRKRFDTDEARAFWRSAFATKPGWSEGRAERRALDTVLYEQCFAPGDEITITGRWGRIRSDQDGDPVDIPTYRPQDTHELVIGCGAPSGIGGIALSELNALRAIFIPVGMLFELAFLSGLA